MDKYQQWWNAEQKAQAAETAVRVPHRNWKGWHPRTPAAEEQARKLRVAADDLFGAAMAEMHREVENALRQAVRRPSSW